MARDISSDLIVSLGMGSSGLFWRHVLGMESFSGLVLGMESSKENESGDLKDEASDGNRTTPEVGSS